MVGTQARPGSLEWFAGAFFIGGIVAGVAAPILELSDVIEPYEDLDTTGVQIAGIVLFAIGVVGTFGAQVAMGASWRIGVDESERTELVTDGPFAIVRNPIYSAMFPTLIGIALLDPNPISFGAVLLLGLGLEMQTRLVEEPYLRQVHGDAYATTRPASAASFRGSAGSGRCVAAGDLNQKPDLWIIVSVSVPLLGVQWRGAGTHCRRRSWWYRGPWRAR